MYLLNEMLLASPLAIYVCLRVRSLFSSKPLKNLWMALFVLVVAGFPVADALSRGKAGDWAKAAVFFGFCSLPFLLYLIMTVILVDIAVGLLRLAGVVSKETVRTRRFRNWRLVLSLAVPLLVVAYGVVNHRVLRVKEYRVEIPRRCSTAGELTVVFMAA